MVTSSLIDGQPPVRENGATQPIQPVEQSIPRRLGRRRFLRRLLMTSGAAVVGGGLYAWRIEPVWVQVLQQRMAIPGLGREFEGTRLIQISDPHVGGSVPPEYLRKWIKWTTAQQADIVVVTGDLVDRGRIREAPLAADLLSGLRAKEGVFLTLGNHDWGTNQPGAGRPQVAERVAAAFTGGAVRLLRNESVAVRRGGSELHLVGLDDFWGQRFDPDLAFARVPRSAPSIALSHNPDTFPELASQPACWVLSGHTHGGQVSIPLFGPPILPVRHRQYVAGHFEVNGRHLYVNRGLGWLERVRFNARPEITVFTLTKA